MASRRKVESVLNWHSWCFYSKQLASRKVSVLPLSSASVFIYAFCGHYGFTFRGEHIKKAMAYFCYDMCVFTSAEGTMFTQSRLNRPCPSSWAGQVSSQSESDSLSP